MAGYSGNACIHNLTALAYRVGDTDGDRLIEPLFTKLPLAEDESTPCQCRANRTRFVYFESRKHSGV